MFKFFVCFVIEILHHTTTDTAWPCIRLSLYLIGILHQTTTHPRHECRVFQLYLIEILHQTTTVFRLFFCVLRCILLKFYIKPQHRCTVTIIHVVVSYWNSTSNHNDRNMYVEGEPVVSYWNSTSNHNRAHGRLTTELVVSYWNSTSNHNAVRAIFALRQLYLIEILHQTTTPAASGRRFAKLYLIEILHQTTTSEPSQRGSNRCILLKFYIKPQLLSCFRAVIRVVSYWNSTSNHNVLRFLSPFPTLYLIEILHQTTTVKHFSCPAHLLYLIEILHQTTTPGQQTDQHAELYLIEILHQTTTASSISLCTFVLYLIEILHQTTTWHDKSYSCWGCILLKFYIKPQLHSDCCLLFVVVSYWNSTSNHNRSR